MRKTKRMFAIVLGCVMLIGGTLTASAAPYNSPCPSCNYPNSGVKTAEINCLLCQKDAGKYTCGHCGKSYAYCSNCHRYMFGI